MGLRGIEMNGWKLSVAAVMLLTVAGCQKAAGSHDADVQALKDYEVQWNRDIAAKDADKVAAHYADDAVMIAPGEPAINGKAAIGATWKHMLADPAMSLTFVASKVEVSSTGDLAFTEGAYQLTITDEPGKQVIHDHGSYATTYRKQADGAWLAVVDIVTSEVPPPSAVAAKMP
jgi:uncharacterized protein (TIGR02246 family)